MDVLRLDDNYEPDMLIEGYDSMIWTERFATPGEFKMSNPNIEQVMNDIPADSLISLRDTDEIMVVENHSVAIDDNGIPKLETTGRTFETLMEYRAAIPTLDATPNQWDADAASSANAAIFVMNYHLTQGHIDAKDIIPHLYIYNTAGDTDDVVEYTIEPGTLLERVTDFINKGNVGLRNIRYNASMPTNTKIVMEVYKGVDHTLDQTTNLQVSFSVTTGDINNASYLFSTKDYRNVAYVVSPIGAKLVYSPVSPSSPSDVTPVLLTGRDRKVLYVDASDITDEGDSNADTLLNQRGLSELAKHNAKVFFDGEVSPLSDYQYNRDYGLGDQVTLLAQYGVSTNMLVSEFVRTEDSSGETGYPTLVAIETS